MKKILSLILTLSLILSVNLPIALACETTHPTAATLKSNVQNHLSEELKIASDGDKAELKTEPHKFLGAAEDEAFESLYNYVDTFGETDENNRKVLKTMETGGDGYNAYLLITNYITEYGNATIVQFIMSSDTYMSVSTMGFEKNFQGTYSVYSLTCYDDYGNEIGTSQVHTYLDTKFTGYNKYRMTFDKNDLDFTAAELSEDHTNRLRILFMLMDSFLDENLGLSMNEMGFWNYKSHIFCRPNDGYHVGPTKLVGKKCATLSANGKTGNLICTNCSKTVKKSAAISKISKVSLSKISYTYNGKVQTPSVTVKDSKGKTLKRNADYTVKYASGRKNIGKYSVTIKFKGNYSGSKTLSFTIVPKGTKLSSLSAGKKKLTAKWKAQKSNTSGYQIQYSTQKNFKGAKYVTVKKNKTTSCTVKKLKSKKKYYVRVRTYKTVGKSKYYSSWSSAKKTTVK